MASETHAVVLSAVPTGDGKVVVTVGVDVTVTAQATMPAWAYYALGPAAVAEHLAEGYQRTVRTLKRRPS